MAGAAEVPVGAEVPEDWLGLVAGEVGMMTWEEREVWSWEGGRKEDLGL